MKNQRTSSVLTSIDARITGLRAINPHLDFGNDRSLAGLTTTAEQLRTKLAEHNNLLAALETSRNELNALEDKADTLSKQMLKGVEFQYGQDSHEYELAGGTKTSDRIRKMMKSRLQKSSKGQSSDRSTVA
ncbi:MAG: hypothetical protein MUC48_12790 [Leptolyngbya sp. Prado105]|jgi:hypothetical protein|nr:hypothetical protein [Leptolyngbya sp. Prado105]